MNLTNLFEIQRKLDAEIEEKHPTTAGEDRLAKRILALQVELGECANEWRGFKFWSNDQEPRKSVQVPNSEMDPLNIGVTVGMKSKNPLLEEYVDCLHFILSLGNILNFDDVEEIEELVRCSSPTEQFIELQGTIYLIHGGLNHLFPQLFDEFIYLGEMLGFTWEQIEDAYMSKNAINHQRQAEGY